jgi:hypothetical protein
MCHTKFGKTVTAKKQELNCDKNWYTSGKKQSVTAMKAHNKYIEEPTYSRQSWKFFEECIWWLGM